MKKSEGTGQKTSIALDPDLWRKVRYRALDEGATARKIVERALKAYLATSAKTKGGKHGTR